MYSATKTSLLLIGAIGLAGCDGTSDTSTFDTTFTSFDEIDAALTPDVEAVVAENGDLLSVPAANISDSDDFDTLTAGSVTYNGAIIAQEADDAGTLIGQLQIVADLDSNGIEGTAGNFFHSVDGEVTGQMTGSSIFSEDVASNGDHFAMLLGGSLQQDGAVFNATVNLAGNFFNDADSVDQVAGDADFDFGDGGPDYEEGAFQASR